MKLRFLRKFRLLVLIATGLLAVSGMFPGVVMTLLGMDRVEADTMLVFLMVYFVTFLLIILWLILAAYERRLMRDETNELDP